MTTKPKRPVYMVCDCSCGCNECISFGFRSIVDAFRVIRDARAEGHAATLTTSPPDFENAEAAQAWRDRIAAEASREFGDRLAFARPIWN